MTMRDEALSYARAGIAIFPLYTVQTTDAGETICTCWNGRDCGRNAGKHPLVQYAPHGLNNATTDEAVILTWPEDGYNLGVAMTDTMVALDIDDVETAAALLQLDLRDTDVVNVTPRPGMHNIVFCASTVSGIIKTAEGKKLGEVRAKGQYIVAPPSLHVRGQYRWLGETLIEAVMRRRPHVAEDAYTCAIDLLGRVGVNVAPHVATIRVSTVGPIAAAELPFAVPAEATILRSLLSGTYPSTDRSDTLYQLACEVYRQADKVGYLIAPQEVASVIKKVDAIAYHKFTGRADEDVRVWEIATKAQIDASADIVKAAEARADVVASVGNQAYEYDTVAGFVHKTSRRGKDGKPETTMTRICNFEPVIAEALEVWNGTTDEVDNEEWIVTATRGSTVKAVRITPADRASHYKFRETMERYLPSTFVVEVGKWDNLLTGMRHYSDGKTTHRRTYAATGWVRDEDAFILPALPGAITAHGMNEAMRFEDPRAPERLLQYGENMKPSCELLNALRTLYGVAAPPIIVPIVMQALAAPLLSLGAARERTFMFILAKTGERKTSLARGVMSLYGRFTGTARIDTWTGTVNSLQATMHRVRDLPLLIDDYKTSMFKRDQKADVTRLVQNYADGSARTRMGRDQKELVHLNTQCNAIGTGEDVWEEQQSLLARTIVIQIPPGGIPLDNVIALHNAAESGEIGSLGYAWIEWLCSVGQAQLRIDFDALQRQMLEGARKTALGQEHPRVVSAVASLLAVDVLFTRFIAARAPEFSAEYAQIRKAGWLETMNKVAVQQHEARSLQPFDHVRGALVEAMAAGQIRFSGRLQSDVDVGLPHASEVVGYADAAAIYLSKQLTWSWFQLHHSRRGVTEPFSWNAVTAHAKDEYGCLMDVYRVYNAGATIRMLRIPLDTFFAGDEAVGQ